MSKRQTMKRVLAFGLVAGGLIFAQQQERPPRVVTNQIKGSPNRAEADVTAGAGYLLGPGDQLAIRIPESEETSDRPVVVDTTGYIRMPLAGRIKVSGLTTTEVEAELASRLQKYFLRPEVLVSITEYRSQPVSVLGAVKNPGVYQLQGRKNLVEVLSMAGGLDATAGSTVKITRRRESGPIPLANATPDPTGQYSIAEVALAGILEAHNPQENIPIRQNDVITVPPAEMIYVVGQVNRAGGFTLHDKETLTVLQALSLAGGLESAASPQHARIIRTAKNGPQRTEVAIDLRRILEGRVQDVPMQPNDILFVPSSTPKKAGVRAMEAALQTATGVVIWRR